MNEKNNINKKRIITLSIGGLAIIGIAIIISIVIFKIDGQAQLKRLDVPQVAVNVLDQAASKSLLNKHVLVRDLNKTNKDLTLAKLGLQNKSLLAKQLNKSGKQLLLTELRDHRSLLVHDLSKTQNLLELLSLHSTVKAHLPVDAVELRSLAV